MSQHTPAPWIMSVKADGTGRKIIHNANGRIVAVVQHDKDACLIVKTPEMYVMLQRLVATFVGTGTTEYEEVRALLREIEG